MKCSTYAIADAFKVDDPAARFLFMTAHNHFWLRRGSYLPDNAYQHTQLGVLQWNQPYMDGIWRENRMPVSAGTTSPQLRANGSCGTRIQVLDLTSILSKISVDVAEWAKYLHQTAIDFGAHPNKAAVYSNMRLETTLNGTRLEMEFLHTTRASSLTATKFVIETGIFVVGLFGRAFPEADQSHGLLKAATRHATALSTLIEQSAEFVTSDTY